jgi:hypothetical protein
MSFEDENAFGLLVAYHDIEDEEYGLERERFVERFRDFRAHTLDYARAERLGSGVRVLDLGHAIYFELGDGDHAADPFSWLRGLRTRLSEQEFNVTAVLSHGSRWLPLSEAQPEPVEGYDWVNASTPSEPLRRALAAEAATHESDEHEGWGPGVYLDTEAVEALGRTLKNAPTPLTSAGATFYRIGR